MVISLIGLLVACAIAIAGRMLGSALIVGLCASIAFGATSIGMLPALGGSSPQIFTLFGGFLILMTVLRPGAVRDLQSAVTAHWSLPVAAALGIYAVLGAIIFPRAFAGQTSAFVPIAGRIYEVPLSPVSGNISQAAYLLVGILVFIFLTAWLARTRPWRVVLNGLLAFSFSNAVLGTLDFGGKSIGIADTLAPIRTANYVLMTSASEQGFWRISGGHSEASGFAISALAALCIAFSYWRSTGSRTAALLALINGGLLVVSTSTTGYVAIVILGCIFLSTAALRGLSGRFHVTDMAVGTLAIYGAFILVVLIFMRHSAVQGFLDLLDTMVLRKGTSASSIERSYWNTQSLLAARDTFGLGIGIGSSRASSWIIAVLSQLGVIGFAALSALVFAAWRLPSTVPANLVGNGINLSVLAKTARAAALAPLVATSISGGNADPGMLTFFGLAVIVSLHIVTRDLLLIVPGPSHNGETLALASLGDHTPNRSQSLHNGTEATGALGPTVKAI